jgi:hypothetical protein
MSEHIEDERISAKDAYKAMFLFLDSYWKLRNKKSDELAGLSEILLSCLMDQAPTLRYWMIGQNVCVR